MCSSIHLFLLDSPLDPVTHVRNLGVILDFPLSSGLAAQLVLPILLTNYLLPIPSSPSLQFLP